MLRLDETTMGKYCLLLMFIVGLSVDFLYSVLGFPYTIRRLIYFSAFTLFFITIVYQTKLEKNRNIILHIPYWQYSILFFCFYIALTATIKTDIHAFQNYLGTYISGYSVFCATILFFDISYFHRVYKVSFIILIVHTVLTILEFFLTDDPDMAGGVFGITFGYSNTCSHAFIILVTILFAVGFVYDKVSYLVVFCVLGLCIITAGFAEIKIYYFELAFLLIIYALFVKRSMKTLLAVAVFGIALYIGTYIIAFVNPYFANFFSIEGVSGYLDAGYGGKTFAVTRTNGYSFIYENVFDRSLMQTIFGNGFADDRSAIYTEYNIGYFTYSKLFYFSGIFGSIIYFFLPIIAIVRLFEKNKDEYKIISGLVGIFMIVCSFYNSECTTATPSILYYFLLALGFKTSHQDNNK